MKKIALTFALHATIFAQAICYASAPTRAYTYESGQVIAASQVNTNETALYTYLQGGVDTIAASVITDTNISPSASISYSKLNLLGQIKNADVSTSAAIAYSKLNLTNSIVDGDIVSVTSAGKVSGAALTSLSSTPSGAGALPIANGGTGQATAQAAIDALLPSQTSNSGKFLTTNGTNASWGTVSPSGYSNVLFQWHGGGGTTTGAAPSVVASGAAQTAYYIAGVTTDSMTYSSSLFTTKFIKSAGVSTVTIYFYCEENSAGGVQSYIKAAVGSATGTVNTTNDDTPRWRSLTVDVSALSDGTAYDVSITIAHNTGDDMTTFIYDLIAFGS